MHTPFLEVAIPVILALILIPVYFRVRIKVLKVYPSKYAEKVSVYERFNGERVLALKAQPQGIGINRADVKTGYWYRIFQLIINKSYSTDTPKILVLGLGANTITRLVYESNPKIHQTIVEIDPAVVEACQEYFGLKEMINYEVVVGDVFRVIEDKKLAWKGRFDSVVIDLYIGEKPFVVEETGDPDFIDKITKFLKSDGELIFNRPSNTEETRLRAEQILSYLEKQFKKVALYDVEDTRKFSNYVLNAKAPLRS